MLVNVRLLGEGPGPSEKVVSLLTKSGEAEEVVLSIHDIANGRIEIGSPLAYQDGFYLIELPRESSSGKWRLWVPEIETDSNVYNQAAE